MERLLIVGCRRSGTTLLASLLGAHSQINMLNEAYGDEITRLIGKRYQAVKLGYPHISFTKKYSRLYRLLYHKLVLPRLRLRLLGWKIDMLIGSKYSIHDYEKMGAKIVIIHRNKKPNVDSMIRRSEISKKKAEKDWQEFNDKSFNIKGAWHISLSSLTEDTEQCLIYICKYLDIEFEKSMLLSSGMNNSYKNHTIEIKN